MPGGPQQPMQAYQYAVSADVNSILRFELAAVRGEFFSSPPTCDLFLTCDLYMDRKKFATAQIRDLSKNSIVVFSLRADRSASGSGEPPKNFSCVKRLFDEDGVLVQGREYLVLEDEFFQHGCEFLPKDILDHTTVAHMKKDPGLANALKKDKLLDLYERGCIPSVSWPFQKFLEAMQKERDALFKQNDRPMMCIQFPVFAATTSSMSLPFPTIVVFSDSRYEKEKGEPTSPTSKDEKEPPQPIGKMIRNTTKKNAEGENPLPWFAIPEGWGLNEDTAGNSLSSSHLNIANSIAPPEPSSNVRGLAPEDGYVGGSSPSRGTAARRLDCGWVPFVDYDAEFEHPAALKYMKLEKRHRALLKSSAEHERPNAAEMKKLTDILQKPRPYHLTAEERHLLLRFRYSLQERKDALTKFLFAVDWQDADEKAVAIEMLTCWVPVEIDIALELLSTDFKGVPEVRRYAVNQLETVDEEEIRLYLLQLVQALRYEDLSGPTGSAPLTVFLIRKAVKSRPLANYLYWYVRAEADEHTSGGVYDQVLNLFNETIAKENSSFKIVLRRQRQLRRRFQSALNAAKAARRQTIDKKIDIFRSELKAMRNTEETSPVQGQEELDLQALPMLPLPVDPDVLLQSILIDECFMLKSAMYPAVFKCHVMRQKNIKDDKNINAAIHSLSSPVGSPSSKGSKSSKKSKNKNKDDPFNMRSDKKDEEERMDWEESEGMYMYKIGDDLRQDQLIMQLVILMDQLLKKYGLDLKLTPYKVIATSLTDGFIEFVPNTSTLSSVLAKHNQDIQQFFKGDRHLDNLLIDTDGHLFHIDFGYILGKDPKPFPPPMKLCREMVEAMGGAHSQGYENFRSKACQAYKLLRRHATLIVNLLYLMADSGIKDLERTANEPVAHAIVKVQEKFRMDLNDEQAEVFFLHLIDDSVSALFPVVMEKIHKFALYWK